jgi:hypothetical protein
LWTGVAAHASADQPPIDFAATFIPWTGLTVSFDDLNRDGWLDTALTRNDGFGNLSVVPTDVGLGDLLFYARDVRIADFDGDGFADLVSNCYRDLGDTSCVGRLFHGNGDGTFREDLRFADLGVRGYGETIVVADFDNDGDVDIFIPQYSFLYPEEHSYLLVNGPGGTFTDMADLAGVSLRGRAVELRPEGAQAVDFDGDGWIDLYVSGHFFFNNGDLTFTDRREALGLPELFDEGLKFVDWNNDGRLDLILHDPAPGPRLFEFDGSRFVERTVFSPQTYFASYGLNVHDLDNDGFEDLITSGGLSCDTVVHRNVGDRFVRAPVPALAPLCNGWGAPAFGDINRDGRIDLAYSDWVDGTRFGYFINQTASANGSFTVDVRGELGAANQFGRVVRASPVSRPDVVYTRVVDGGSGYMSQSQYPLLVGTPFEEPHHVEVRYNDRTVRFETVPGATARVRPDGTVTQGGAGDQPSVWVSRAQAREGDSGTPTMAFTVTVFGQSTGDVSLDWATEDGTATAGDYAGASGTLVIPVGSSTGTIEVSLNGDTTVEADETLILRSSHASNATLRTPLVTGTILNDDLPTISVAGASVSEEDSGTAPLAFAVALSAAFHRDVTVRYTTADDTATAGSDYEAVSGTLTIPAGSTAATIEVPVNGDAAVEADETLALTLADATNAMLGTAVATGTILDDDVPTISVTDASVTEGDSGTESLAFAVALSVPFRRDVIVRYTTGDGTATAGSDYAAVSGTLTIPAGSTAATIPVTVNGDATIEGDETVSLTLADATNATLGTSSATGTILDDEPPQSISIDDVSVSEGDTDGQSARFTVSLSSPSVFTVEVSYSTEDGTAVSGSDFNSSAGTLTFPPQITRQTVVVETRPDRTFEPDETFSVTLGAPTNAVIARARGLGTILNDESTPALSVDDVVVREQRSGTEARLAVTLDPVSSQTVTVSYATDEGNARSGVDFEPASGTTTFSPGAAAASISVVVRGDASFSGNRTFSVRLNEAVNAEVRKPQGTVTIVDRITTGDLDADGYSDILWRAVSGQAAGALFAWTMNGTGVAGAAYLDPISRDWVIQKVADFNGDGKADILWRNMNPSAPDAGYLYVWLMNGSRVIGASYTNSQADFGWQVQGVGDLNGDGNADIVWRKAGPGSDTGAIFLWLMQGANIIGATYLDPISVDWQIQRIADFNGDGTADILWRNMNPGASDAGYLYVWMMNGPAVIEAGYTNSQADFGWQVQEVGDLNGDGKADIVWRKVGPGLDTGAMFLWQMNGADIIGATYLDPISTDWQIQGVADFNGDGKSDVLWRNLSHGAADAYYLYIWMMNGPTVSGGTGYTNSQANAAWDVKNPR